MPRIYETTILGRKVKLPDPAYTLACDYHSEHGRDDQWRSAARVFPIRWFTG